MDDPATELAKLLRSTEAALSPSRELAKVMEEVKTHSALSDFIDNQEVMASQIATLNTCSPLINTELQTRLLELSTAFEQTRIRLAEASQFAYATSAFSKALRAAEQIKLTTFVFPEFPNLTFPKLPQIDSERTINALRKGAIRLSECGWAIPEWATPREIQELGECTDGDIDDFFVVSYLGNNSNQGQLERVSRNLLASIEMEMWRSLLEEIFYCVQNGKYRVCVPALLTILEGFTAHSLYKRLNTSRRQTNVSVSINRAAFHSDKTVEGVIWRSVVVFLNRLFASFDFESASPTFINRHWILHGRSDTEWTSADALKLVNALATMHWLFS